jgi:hypothetical protein
MNTDLIDHGSYRTIAHLSDETLAYIASRLDPTVEFTRYSERMESLFRRVRRRVGEDRLRTLMLG